ncbi:hypothetical protein PISMIDRAFT_12909 [Pisolithus microcarpus 441]|uniref:Uncharacterized protein n=1 Tax=Pisolithus microcarpus 441 TaxID=765257 RepID=A0A0C9ZKU5_9AGAM|nr:hypothetical protein BKA83DRAFT_12909 [Pisolithus microcarpus]KIK20528.1 hypothetical protein PISMIDRAFT_12909 [Pisolithus microcarpus 441]
MATLLGSTDGYNTEYPERLHIDYAKDAYRVSNKRDYVEQMALWLQWQEAIYHESAYLAWRQLKTPLCGDSVDDDSSDIGKAGSVSELGEQSGNTCGQLRDIASSTAAQQQSGKMSIYWHTPWTIQSSRPAGQGPLQGH